MDGHEPELQDATERLRARFAGKPIAAAQPARRSVLPWIIAALLLVFALGLIANPWFEANVRGNIPGLAAVIEPPTAGAAVRIAALEARLRSVETTALPVATLPALPPSDERVAALEARLDGLERSDSAAVARIDTLTGGVAALTGRVDANAGQTVLTLQAARVDADRAQAALSVLAARRAIDGGRWSPGLAVPLRTLFGAQFGPSVEAVVALGSAPVTPAMLREDVTRLRGTATGPEPGWWERLSASFGNIVEVRDRRPGTTDPLAQAEAALAAGDLTRAITAVERLPRGPGVALWLQQAQRYQAGQRGLAILEEAALTLRPAPALAAPAPLN